MATDVLQWLAGTASGMLTLSIGGGVLAIVLLAAVSHSLSALIRPNIEHTFYERILRQWFNGFFLRHRIIATFIRMNRMGDTIVNAMIHLTATFIIVAFLSAALTASSIFIAQDGFIYSPRLLILMIANIALLWALVRNVMFFRKLMYRLP